MFGINFRSAKTSAAAKTAPAAPAPMPVVAQPVVQAPAPMPVVAQPVVQAPAPVAPAASAPSPVVPQPTKLERLQEIKRAERAAEAILLAKAQEDIEAAEALKQEYIDKANEKRAERAATLALAEEIRLAKIASAKAADKANAAAENLEYLTESYSESLLDMEDKQEALLDSLLAEFGC